MAHRDVQKSEESAIARRLWKGFFIILLQCLLYYAVVPLDFMVIILFAGRRHGREEASYSSGTQKSTSPSEWLLSMAAAVFGKANCETTTRQCSLLTRHLLCCSSFTCCCSSPQSACSLVCPLVAHPEAECDVPVSTLTWLL